MSRYTTMNQYGNMAAHRASSARQLAQRLREDSIRTDPRVRDAVRYIEAAVELLDLANRTLRKKIDQVLEEKRQEALL